jgi:hypothetical protein
VRFPLIAILFAAACAGPRAAVVTPVTSSPSISPHGNTIDLAAGDPAAGRATFVERQCHACHRVPEDASLPVFEGAWDGPVLGDLGDASAEAVAWRIVTRTRLAPESVFESEMVDAASGMTERQLVDLVAYLRRPAAAPSSH